MQTFTKSTTCSDSKTSSPDIKLQLTGFGAQQVVRVDDILRIIDRLPAYHLQRLKEITYDPQRLFLRIALDNQQGLSPDTQGLFVQSHRTIAIFKVPSRQVFIHTLLHELGHHVYFQIIGSVLKKQWVTEICRHDGFITQYAARNAAEDFAECYVAYLLEPDTFKQLSLKYLFIRQHVFKNQCYVPDDNRLDFQV